MKHHVILLLLFFVLYSASALGYDLSLAPGFSVKNAFLYFLFLAMAIETAVTRHRGIEAASVLAPFTLYVAYAVFMWLVALLVLDYPNYSPRSSLISLKAGPVDDLVIFLIFFYGVTDAQRALWVLRGILWIVIAGNVITVVDALNMPDLGIIHEREDGRVGGPIGSSNPFAYMLAVYVPLMFALYATESGFRKKLAGIGVVFSILALVMTASRGAFVGLLVGAIFGAYFLRKAIPAATLVKAGFGVLSMMVVVTASAYFAGYGDLLIGRFEQFGGSDFEVTSGRSSIWALLVNKMLDSPGTFVSGFGWYAYATFQNSLQFGYSPHSHYLLILFNLGMVGLSLWLITAVSILRLTRIAIADAVNGARPYLVAFIFGFLSLVVALIFNDSMAWLYIWALVGLCLRVAVSQLSSSSVTPPRSQAEHTRPLPERNLLPGPRVDAGSPTSIGFQDSSKS